MKARSASSARVVGRDDGAAAERDDRGLRGRQHLGGDLLLGGAEAVLAGGGEQVDDGGSGSSLDLEIEVDERPPERDGELLGRGRLARSHEARERHMPPQRVQVAGCHRTEMRSR